jgi:hypothetical protein
MRRTLLVPQSPLTYYEAAAPERNNVQNPTQIETIYELHIPAGQAAGTYTTTVIHKPRQHILYASGHLSRPDVSGENPLLEHPIFPPTICHVLHGVMFEEK